MTRHGPWALTIVDAVRNFDQANECTCNKFGLGRKEDAVPVKEVKAVVTEPEAGMNEQRFSQTSQPLAVLYIFISGDDGPGPWLFDGKSAGNHL